MQKVWQGILILPAQHFFTSSQVSLEKGFASNRVPKGTASLVQATQVAPLRGPNLGHLSCMQFSMYGGCQGKAVYHLIERMSHMYYCHQIKQVWGIWGLGFLFLWGIYFLGLGLVWFGSFPLLWPG